MTRLGHLFLQKDAGILNVYFTAGYPSLHDTLPIMKALEEAGADIIELGMPYSDPLADGPVIQQSSMVALDNGMTIATLLGQLKDFRSEVSLPVVLMGYINPVLQYGFEKFCTDAAAAGVDGLIIPDLPEFEFETIYGSVLARQGLDFIFLVTPETSEERLRKLDALSNGFIYAVSSSSTTGTDKNMEEVGVYLERLKSMNLRNPVMAGFGIRDKQTFDSACLHANGAIIGSAFVKALEGSADVAHTVKKFIAGVRNG
ncbi:MAG: tryptophan synthase subunit alpha [Chitinophagaceae bacterium]|nr:MAG: tryptophan synthase subunit alpha [Chitinophagaceae bacterium]